MINRFELAIRVAPLALLATVGCTAELLSVPNGHDDSEMRFASSQLAAEWTTEGDWSVAPIIESHEGISRVGIMLAMRDSEAMPRIQTRLVDENGEGEWMDVTETWGEEDHHVGIAELGTTGMRAELRVATEAVGRIAHFRWNATIPAPVAEDTSEIGASQAPLRSELSGLGIVTRSSWGARSTRCSNSNPGKNRMAIHHTVTGSSNPARQMRAIQNYHMDSRGWCDVGYHFLVGSDGKIYEGRPLELQGAHVGGNNTGNIGISFIGCYHTSGCGGLGNTTPGQNMIDAAGGLVGELSRLYGISVTASQVKGHREHSGASTSCPGDNLHRRLGDIRRIGGTTTAPPAPAPPAPAPPAPAPPAPAPPSGESCTHTYGATYADGSCSAGYVCQDGRWRVRSASTSCGCVEPTGRVGCAAMSGPPPGASCSHTYGGSYANTACSPSYQCCNGRWGTRGSCGSCYCEESSGRSGCGT